MNKKPILFIIISASFFGISAPLAKLLLKDISAIALAGLLYLGAFAGLSLYSLLFQIKRTKAQKSASLEKKDLPWLAGAIITGGIIAPISLMTGLTLITGFSASLLLNLEGVATVLIAVLIFRENSGKRLWLAIVTMTIAGVFLSWDPNTGKFNIIGSLLIVLATVCWGIDNNITRKISDKDPIQISMIKGLIAGTISLSLAFILGNKVPLDISVFYALLLGAFSYGMSLVFFVNALRGLGASRVGAFYSFGPFIGALLSIVIFRDMTIWVIVPAFSLMAVGVWLLTNENHKHAHLHQNVIHIHSHGHDDMHHAHEHSEAIEGNHTHEHAHDEISHVHEHFPDTHHRHAH
jgi:drug/metabolite transporter (DMT)-like permease